MRHLIPFDDEQIEAHFEGQDVIGDALGNVTFTDETLDDLLERHRDSFREPGETRVIRLGGHRAVTIEDAMPGPDQSRASYAIIDYGPVRAIMGGWPDR